MEERLFHLRFFLENLWISSSIFVQPLIQFYRIVLEHLTTYNK